MNRLKAFLQLSRWMNLVMLGILVWTMERWVAAPLLCDAYFGAQLPWYTLTLLMAAIILIAAGGYVINDYFDIKIDRINRPERLIVTNGIDKPTTMRFYTVLTAAGIVCGLAGAWLTRSWTIGLTMVLVPGLLWFYSSSYKRQFILGNLIVSFLSALPPLVIAAANTGVLRHRFGDIISYSPIERMLYLWLGGFALFAFLTTWMREIIKDLQDQDGDRELECHTLPVRIGDKASKWTVTALAIVVTGLLVWIGYWLLPYESGWNTLSGRYILFGLITPLACAVWLMWAAKIPSDYRSAQGVMKFVMLMGMLYSFVIYRML